VAEDEVRAGDVEPPGKAAEAAAIPDRGADDLVDGLVPVARLADGDEAREVARRLVERGIGASVRPAGPSAPGTGHGPGDVEVRVLPEERGRALAILGGDADEPGSLPTPGGTQAGTAAIGSAADGPVRPERLPVPWKSVLAIWLAALVIIPLVAGLAVYFVLSH
jgi:hypothetical protein